jgi:hypothetical protein
MKLKNIRKKIRRLETRLQKDAKKLAKLKSRLETATTPSLAKTKKKSAAGTGKTRKIIKVSAQFRKKPGRRVEPPAAARTQSAGKTVKRKLNLTPERRAQLAAAMKARWAAKRAAAASSVENSSSGGDFTLGQAPQQ